MHWSPSIFPALHMTKGTTSCIPWFVQKHFESDIDVMRHRLKIKFHLI